MERTGNMARNEMKQEPTTPPAKAADCVDDQEKVHTEKLAQVQENCFQVLASLAKEEDVTNRDMLSAPKKALNRKITATTIDGPTPVGIIHVPLSNIYSKAVQRKATAEYPDAWQFISASSRRFGKWTNYEITFASKLMELFKVGLVKNLQRHTTLRAFVATALNCDPMRVSKKWPKHEALGKQVYVPCKEPNAPFTSLDDELEHAGKELDEACLNFLEAFQSELDGERTDDEVRQIQSAVTGKRNRSSQAPNEYAADPTEPKKIPRHSLVDMANPLPAPAMVLATGTSATPAGFGTAGMSSWQPLSHAPVQAVQHPNHVLQNTPMMSGHWPVAYHNLTFMRSGYGQEEIITGMHAAPGSHIPTPNLPVASLPSYNVVHPSQNREMYAGNIPHSMSPRMDVNNQPTIAQSSTGYAISPSASAEDYHDHYSAVSVLCSMKQ